MSNWRVGWEPKPEVLQAIPLSAIDTFLVRRGWVQKPSSRPTSRYYEHPDRRLDDGRPLHYFFPATDHFADYPLRVLDFVENFARYYELDPHAVLAELQGGPLAEPVRASVSA
jgi:hypothetical protein